MHLCPFNWWSTNLQNKTCFSWQCPACLLDHSSLCLILTHVLRLLCSPGKFSGRRVCRVHGAVRGSSAGPADSGRNCSGNSSLQLSSASSAKQGAVLTEDSRVFFFSFRIVVLQKTLESLVNPKGNQPWIFIGRTDAEAEAPILWPAKSRLIGKHPDARKDWGQEEEGVTEEEMVGWHHQLGGHELEQILGDSEGQPGVLQSMGLQRVRHDLVAEQQQVHIYSIASVLRRAWAGTLCKMESNHASFSTPVPHPAHPSPIHHPLIVLWVTTIFQEYWWVLEVKDDMGDALLSWRSRVTTMLRSKGNEDTYPCKNSYLNAYGSVITLETTQMPIKWWTDKQNMVHPQTGILLSFEKERSADTDYHVEGPWEQDARWEKPDAEGHTECDSIYMRRWEQANPQTQRVGLWLPGKWGVTTNGNGFLLGWWNVLELNRVDGCTTDELCI